MKKGKTVELKSKLAPKKLEKSQKKPLSNKNKNLEILSDTEILAKLQKSIPRLVAGTVRRYENGHYASIFNWSDMNALAEDTALEVLRRIKIRQTTPENPEGVDLKGADSYFKMAFKNQCLKMYEKYAKTDIRAGIQTLGSEEAMAVAVSKNLYSPEDSYVLSNHFDLIKKTLLEADIYYNRFAYSQAEKFNRHPYPHEKQYYAEIFQKLLDGYTAEEIEKDLNLPNADFLRQKRLMCDYVRSKFPASLRDMREHFTIEEDYRIHTKEVNKRQKLKQAIRDFKPKFLFYVHSVVKDKLVEATLYARIELYDRFENKTNKIPPKLVKIKSIQEKNSTDNLNKIKDQLWKDSKDSYIQKEVEKLAQDYLNESKNKVAS